MLLGDPSDLQHRLELEDESTHHVLLRKKEEEETHHRGTEDTEFG
jgi:hypothetical protein